MAENGNGEYIGQSTGNVKDIGGDKVNPMTTEDVRRLIKALQTLSIKASGGQLRVVVDSLIGGTTVVTQATAANLNMTAALAANQVLGDITNIGGISAKQLQFTNSRMNYAMNTRSHLSYTN